MQMTNFISDRFNQNKLPIVWGGATAVIAAGVGSSAAIIAVSGIVGGLTAFSCPILGAKFASISPKADRHPFFASLIKNANKFLFISATAVTLAALGVINAITFNTFGLGFGLYAGLCLIQATRNVFSQKAADKLIAHQKAVAAQQKKAEAAQMKAAEEQAAIQKAVVEQEAIQKAAEQQAKLQKAATAEAHLQIVVAQEVARQLNARKAEKQQPAIAHVGHVHQLAPVHVDHHQPVHGHVDHQHQQSADHVEHKDDNS